jgi:hypothetical protein
MSDRYQFTRRTIDQAKATQSNVTWWRDTFPMYVIGEKPTDTPKWLDIMMLSASYDGTPMIARVHKESYQKVRERADTTLTTPYSGAELDVMYDQLRGKFTIEYDAPGNMPAPRVQRTFVGAMNGVPASTEVENGLSPDLMEAFDVEKSLIVLATNFGMVHEFDVLCGVHDETIRNLQG